MMLIIGPSSVFERIDLDGWIHSNILEARGSQINPQFADELALIASAIGKKIYLMNEEVMINPGDDAEEIMRAVAASKTV